MDGCDGGGGGADEEGEDDAPGGDERDARSDAARADCDAAVDGGGFVGSSSVGKASGVNTGRDPRVGASVVHAESVAGRAIVRLTPSCTGRARMRSPATASTSAATVIVGARRVPATRCTSASIALAFG